MATAFIGKIFFERGDDNSPTGYTRICTVFSLPGFGKTNSLEDVTTFCSNGSREYIPGVSDGDEISVEANYDQSDASLIAVQGDIDAKLTRPYRIVIEQYSPNIAYQMFLAGIMWKIKPSPDSKNAIEFNFKISGEIEKVTL